MPPITISIFYGHQFSIELFFYLYCIRGKSIEPASLTFVARVVNLRIELVANKLCCLGRPILLRMRICELIAVDLMSNIGFGEVRERRDLYG
ncbi:hypothetical protein Lalb_Chr19g0127791 [Lupinus albus]|uniref:Uncharacterized protein n=1 Tax=Lupinus albus TaxID=3870 RepID=A0A6A4NWT5_LUPAL|nr:hypothetical protein Lalb_Chr19g0127791 [Lupinus albus]